MQGKSKLDQRLNSFQEKAGGKGLNCFLSNSVDTATLCKSLSYDTIMEKLDAQADIFFYDQ